MHIRFSLLVAALLSLSCENGYHNKELYGSYNLNELNISLQPDGRFHYESWNASCLGSERGFLVDGNFKVSGQYVILKPTHAHTQYFEYKQLKDKKLVWDSIQPLNFLHEFYDSLLILPVSKKIFLLGVIPPDCKKTDTKNLLF